jgi:hypothetical protein
MSLAKIAKIAKEDENLFWEFSDWFPSDLSGLGDLGERHFLFL